MAADETGNTLKNAITSERFIRFAPNLVFSNYSSPRRDLQSQKTEIHNPRWPPAAILDFTKTLITFEPFVGFSPNLAWSFVLTPPRHRKGQKCHFTKSKMAADETGYALKNAITSEWCIRFAPNLVFSIYSSTVRRLQSQKPEIRNPRWPPAAILNFTKTLITFEPFVQF
jgi:hypothetical protein